MEKLNNVMMKGLPTGNVIVDRRQIETAPDVSTNSGSGRGRTTAQEPPETAAGWAWMLACVFIILLGQGKQREEGQNQEEGADRSEPQSTRIKARQLGGAPVTYVTPSTSSDHTTMSPQQLGLV